MGIFSYILADFQQKNIIESRAVQTLWVCFTSYETSLFETWADLSKLLALLRRLVSWDVKQTFAKVWDTHQFVTYVSIVRIRPTLLRKIVGYGFTNTSMWKISCPTISKPFKFTWTVVSINSLKKESLKVLGFMYSISNEFLFSFFHGIWANKVNFPGQLLSSTCPATVQLSELSRNWNNYSHGRLSSGF